MEWRGNRYTQVEEGAVKQRLQPWLHKALRYVVDRQTGEPELTDFESNPSTIGAALESVRALTHLSADITPAAWLAGADGRPDPRELLPFPSGTLHVPTRQVLAPTPALFNVNAIDFDYDPQAEPPERWIRFLEQLWGDDMESVHALQEWMGYCLVADTSQHKILLMVGPKRSGKGTIGRVMGRLVGQGNVAGPTTSTLAEQFGMQELIGKSLAILSDARFTGDEVPKAMERMLCISGEDPLTISRKYLGGAST
jgi:putative DNA primase/helicase